MTRYINLLNLIAGTPNLLDRLTTALRRDRSRRPRQILLSQSGQSPPQSQSRRKSGLWADRLRIQSIRPAELSSHLRRDIGLDF